jgi:hypothetical protein
VPAPGKPRRVNRTGPSYEYIPVVTEHELDIQCLARESGTFTGTGLASYQEEPLGARLSHKAPSDWESRLGWWLARVAVRLAPGQMAQGRRAS